jgi:hypothetical protein
MVRLSNHARLNWLASNSYGAAGNGPFIVLNDVPEGDSP